MLLLIITFIISWCFFHDIVSADIPSPVLNALSVAIKHKKTGKQMTIQVLSRWDLRKPAQQCCWKAAGSDGRTWLQLMERGQATVGESLRSRLRKQPLTGHQRNLLSLMLSFTVPLIHKHHFLRQFLGLEKLYSFFYLSVLPALCICLTTSVSPRRLLSVARSSLYFILCFTFTCSVKSRTESAWLVVFFFILYPQATAVSSWVQRFCISSDVLGLPDSLAWNFTGGKTPLQRYSKTSLWLSP